MLIKIELTVFAEVDAAKLDGVSIEDIYTGKVDNIQIIHAGRRIPAVIYDWTTENVSENKDEPVA